MDEFDPYRQWLGIHSEDRPVNHYELLGLTPFESNRLVIEHAADERMTLVRSFQHGPRGELTQDLLNELATARRCLLTPDRKLGYDRNLRGSLGIEEPQNSAVAAPTRPNDRQPNKSDDARISSAHEDDAIDFVGTSDVLATEKSIDAFRPKPGPQLWPILLVVAASLFVIGLVFHLANRGDQNLADSRLRRPKPLEDTDTDRGTRPEVEQSSKAEPASTPSGSQNLSTNPAETLSNAADDPAETDRDGSDSQFDEQPRSTPDDLNTIDTNAANPVGDPVSNPDSVEPVATGSETGEEASPATMSRAELTDLLDNQVPYTSKKESSLRRSLNSEFCNLLHSKAFVNEVAHELTGRTQLDVPLPSGYLHGLIVWLNDAQKLVGVQAVYVTEYGLKKGRVFGIETDQLVPLLAPTDFRIHAIRVSKTVPIESIQVTYRGWFEIDDSKDIESPVVGVADLELTPVVRSDAQKTVGLHGILSHDRGFTLGLIQTKPWIEFPSRKAREAEESDTDRSNRLSFVSCVPTQLRPPVPDRELWKWSTLPPEIATQLIADRKLRIPPKNLQDEHELARSAFKLAMQTQDEKLRYQLSSLAVPSLVKAGNMQDALYAAIRMGLTHEPGAPTIVANFIKTTPRSLRVRWLGKRTQDEFDQLFELIDARKDFETGALLADALYQIYDSPRSTAARKQRERVNDYRAKVSLEDEYETIKDQFESDQNSGEKPHLTDRQLNRLALYQLLCQNDEAKAARIWVRSKKQHHWRLVEVLSQPRSDVADLAIGDAYVAYLSQERLERSDPLVFRLVAKQAIDHFELWQKSPKSTSSIQLTEEKIRDLRKRQYEALN
ncbi:MAG: hypothetical protein AAFN77_18665 [Planctomycetota bacterium]